MADIKHYMVELGQRARAAARLIARAETGVKNAALLAMAQSIDAATAQILEANKNDMHAAQTQGLDAALLDRLELNPTRVAAMSDGVRQIAGLPDPGGTITDFKY